MARKILFTTQVEYDYIMSVLKSTQVSEDISYLIDMVTRYEDEGYTVRIDIGCYKDRDYYSPNEVSIIYDHLICFEYYTGDNLGGQLISELQFPELNNGLVLEYYRSIKKGQLCYVVMFDRNITSIFTDLEERFNKLETIRPFPLYGGNARTGIMLKAKIQL